MVSGITTPLLGKRWVIKFGMISSMSRQCCGLDGPAFCGIHLESLRSINHMEKRR